MTPSTTVTKDYEAAWKLLQEPERQSNPDEMKSLIQEYGLFSADELEFLEKDQLDALVSNLKPVQQKRFRIFLGI
jgi:hypothetical protein